MDTGLKWVLILVGGVHLLPALGALGERQLAELYALNALDANLRVLLRHRAVLFGMLGVFLVYAAFVPAVQNVAILAGLLSVASFIVLVWLESPVNRALGKVAVIDVVLLCLLLLVAGLRGLQHG